MFYDVRLVITKLPFQRTAPPRTPVQDNMDKDRKSGRQHDRGMTYCSCVGSRLFSLVSLVFKFSAMQNFYFFYN